jgi:hypothetical protein
MSEPTLSVDRARMVREALEAAGISARLLGGIAIYATCPSAQPPSPLARAYSDVDVITVPTRSAKVFAALEGLELEAAERFNALHGHSRMLFSFADGMHLDVFIARFAMCHELDLASRIELARETLTPADLLLTKLQIAEINKRDVLDLCALLLDHPFTEDDNGINHARVTELLARDWGWWRTVTENLERLVHFSRDVGLDAPAVRAIVARTEELQGRIEAAPRSRRWRLRALVGERAPWREEPEAV